MVFLNDIVFPVYEMDTAETRLNRIAWMLQTAPRFVRVDNSLEELKDDDAVIVATTARKELEEFVENNADFKAIRNHFKTYYPLVEEFVLYTEWKISVRSKYGEMADFMILNSGNEALDQLEKNTNSKFKFYEDPFLIEQTDREKQFKGFELDVAPVRMTPIEIQKVLMEIKFEIDVDLVEIFDMMDVSQNLPYVNNGGDRHKIYKNFKSIGDTWDYGEFNMIQFYVLNSKFPPIKFNERSYSNGIILLAEEKNVAILHIETIIGMQTDLDTLISRIFDSLRLSKSKIISKTEHSLNTITTIPGYKFNKFILADVIFNDPRVNSFFFIDESAKVGRIRNGISFFYQASNSKDRVTISLSETAAELKDHRKYPDLLSVGQTYIRVHINRAKNEHDATEIAKFIGKVFAVYLQSKESLIKIYKSYLPNFSETTDRNGKAIRKVGKSNHLQDIAPDIFIAGYPRACQSPPVIVDHLIAAKFPNGNIPEGYFIENPGEGYRKAMLFPKDDTIAAQHWFACDNNQVPGLRKVSIHGSKFDVLPCCFNRDQDERDTLRAYYYGHEIEKNDSAYTHILITPKFLNVRELGTIPQNLELLFKNFDQNMTIYRTGVNRSPHSFLSAMSLAFGKAVRVSDLQVELCRQNAFDKTSEELRLDLENPEAYINPGIYYRALEEYFKCYIFIFTREGTKGSILHPVHRHSLLRFTREIRPTILILEHMGSESDAATYPQCELIIHTDGDKRDAAFGGNFAKSIENLFGSTLQVYSGNSLIEDINKSDLLVGIKAQGIDSMGKTRVLVVGYQNKDIYILCDPIPPIDYPEVSGFKNNSDSDLIMSYLRFINVEYTIENNMIIFKKGNINYQIPYKMSKTSTLNSFNNNQRIARYLQEYAYHLYSKFAMENGMNPNNINSFLRKYTIVKPGYAYPHIPRRFNLEGKYMEDGKLIVHSLEMAQRLGYSIELFMRRNRSQLQEYQGYDLIQEYYLDKNDFTHRPNAVILMTDTALRNWIDERTVEYMLNTEPSEFDQTFYMKLHDRVVLVQRALSFESALDIAQTWNTEKYNSQSVYQDDHSSYCYYIFESPSSITKVGEHQNEILIWKTEEDRLEYAAILS